MSTNRRTPVLYRCLPKGPNGRNICLVCKTAECPPRRSTFCSPECAKTWNIRSNPGLVRQYIFDRDNGICAACGIDCLGAENRFRHAPEWVKGSPDGMAIAQRWAEKFRRRARGTGHLWQADHIIPVIEGGGECGLENYRTLCTDCHKSETAALRKRMARKEAPCLTA